MDKINSTTNEDINYINEKKNKKTWKSYINIK